jgi:putative transposase
MSWKETCPVAERMKFVLEVLNGELPFAQLCRCYGITRKTGYKWLERYQDGGVLGLTDASRAPLHHPNAVSPEVEEQIVAMRELHPQYGPRKLLFRLQQMAPGQHWPCTSTIGAILKERGLVVPRKRKRHATPYTQPFASCLEPNDTWCIDFKGWFPTGDGRRCDPLTLTDAASRYLLCCHALPNQQLEPVQSRMKILFREYGLPRAIRSDNGTPFASTGLAALTRLSVWWLKLGITCERIRPATPCENGRHERMHLTLKQHTAMPPYETLRRQQKAFDDFRHEYNEERPHEALGMNVPASCYQPSQIKYPARVPDPEYPKHFIVRPVHEHGQIRFRGKRYFLSKALGGEYVGLEPDDTDENRFRIFFAKVPIGWIYLPVLHALPIKRTKKEKE